MAENEGWKSVVGGWQCGKCGAIAPRYAPHEHTCETEMDPKVAALAIHLKVKPDTITEVRHSDDTFEC